MEKLTQTDFHVNQIVEVVKEITFLEGLTKVGVGTIGMVTGWRRNGVVIEFEGHHVWFVDTGNLEAGCLKHAICRYCDRSATTLVLAIPVCENDIVHALAEAQDRLAHG